VQEPKFKPDHWVIYQQGESGGMGRISGGTFGGQGWNYTIVGAAVNGQPYSVSESEIAYLLGDDGKTWSTPSQASGQSAAYTNA